MTTIQCYPWRTINRLYLWKGNLRAGLDTEDLPLTEGKSGDSTFGSAFKCSVECIFCLFYTFLIG